MVLLDHGFTASLLRVKSRVFGVSLKCKNKGFKYIVKEEIKI